jgi:hypothetical protein
VTLTPAGPELVCKWHLSFQSAVLRRESNMPRAALVLDKGQVLKGGGVQVRGRVEQRSRGLPAAAQTDKQSSQREAARHNGSIRTAGHMCGTQQAGPARSEGVLRLHTQVGGREQGSTGRHTRAVRHLEERMTAQTAAAPHRAASAAILAPAAPLAGAMVWWGKRRATVPDGLDRKIFTNAK